MKIIPQGAESFSAYRRKDRKYELIIAFLNFFQGS